MKKYNTKPVDYTGCHPAIAEALKRGEGIECRVWDNISINKKIGFVVGYSVSNAFPYQCDNVGGSICCYAEPIPIKTRRIMPPERAIPVLIAEGWAFDDEGDLVGYGNNVVRTAMFKLMGKPLSDPKVSSWTWPPCIIEEVEDDE